MRYLTLVLSIALFLSLSGCKADMDTDPATAAAIGMEDSVVFCAKFIRMKKPLGSVLQSVSDYPVARATPGDQISTTDFVAEFTYKLTEHPNGNRDIQCVLSDGSRQYYGYSSISAAHAPYSSNLCSIMYDLDNPTGGTFYFYWTNVDSMVTYVDDYLGYTKELLVRSSDCSSM